MKTPKTENILNRNRIQWQYSAHPWFPFMVALCHFSFFSVFSGVMIVYHMDSRPSSLSSTITLQIAIESEERKNRGAEREKEEEKIVDAAFTKTMLSIRLDIHTMCFLPHAPSHSPLPLSQHGVITRSDIYVFWFAGARFIFHCWISSFFVICCLYDYSSFVVVAAVAAVKMMKIKKTKKNGNKWCGRRGQPGEKLKQKKQTHHVKSSFLVNLFAWEEKQSVNVKLIDSYSAMFPSVNIRHLNAYTSLTLGPNWIFRTFSINNRFTSNWVRNNKVWILT